MTNTRRPQVLDLAAARPDPRDEADLRWYLNESEGAMGLRSSFGPMVARLEAPMSHGRPIMELADHQLKAATRARLIRRSLEALAPEHQLVLRSVYLARRDTPAHPDALRRWRELAGLVENSEAARAAHRRSRTPRPLAEWLERIVRASASPTARTEALVLRRQLEGDLLRAMRAYAEARKTIYRTPRRTA
jgi:hypothetical protein